MTLLSTPNTSKKRRRFPAEFKSKIVEVCLQTDVSVAKIALKHGASVSEWALMVIAGIVLVSGHAWLTQIVFAWRKEKLRES